MSGLTLALAISLLSSIICTHINLKLEGKITGGSYAAESQFPFIASIIPLNRDNEWEMCAGSIISISYILTAAHCVHHREVVQIYIGSNTLGGGFGVIALKEAFIIHEKYDPNTDENDISLIWIPELTFNSKIKLVRLPLFTGNYDECSFVGIKALTAGWGCISDADPYKGSLNLRYIEQRVVLLEECEIMYGNLKGHSKLCVSSEHGRSTAPGDSGAPLIYESESVYGPVQIGIMSTGSAEGSEMGHPLVYTRISSYLNWIHEKSGIAYF